jgi:hypothetical protein
MADWTPLLTWLVRFDQALRKGALKPSEEPAGASTKIGPFIESLRS